MKALKVERIFLEDYFGFSGYENFAFYYDEEQKKYSMLNRKTQEATRPFLDEFYLSDFQLGTWTANYFVGRIGDKYYLVDADGNCYFEEDKPFVICKNVFVQADCKYVVNNELETFMPLEGHKIEIYKSENYNFAIVCNVTPVTYDLLTVKGVPASREYSSNIHSSNDKSVTFEGVEDGYLVFLSSLGDSRIYCFLNENFEICEYLIKRHVKKLEGRAGAFTYNGKPIYSSYLYSKIDAYYKYGDVEFAWVNGKSYIFSENQVQEYPFAISEPRLIGDKIYYRASSIIIVLDKQGKEIARKGLEIEEAYKIKLLEELLEKRN